MAKKSKKNKVTDVLDNHWVNRWAKKHVAELKKHVGLVLTLHPEHGIINASPNSAVATNQLQYLKKSIAKDAWLMEANHLLTRLGEMPRAITTIPKPDVTRPRKEKAAPKAWVKKREPTDPIPQLDAAVPVPERPGPPPSLAPLGPADDDVILDGSRPVLEPSEHMTILQFAQANGIKAVDVLLKVLGWTQDENKTVNIHSPLDAETLERLRQEFKKDSPYPSPDKQPPFTPHNPSPGNAKSLVVDGGGAAYRRGLRFD